MSTEHKHAEQNALASGLTTTWTKFKGGQLISYKVMALLLLLVAGLGTWWYISSERRKGVSAQWLEFDDANTPKKLEELAQKQNAPKTSRLAGLLLARTQLGPEGIDLLTSTRNELRSKGVENIEKAREAFGKLLDQFKSDPVLKAECLYGLAKAEMALVAVPVKQDQPVPGPVAATEFRGTVPKLIEYLEQLAAAAAPDTAWATDSKKLAEALKKDPAEFINVQRSLFVYQPPTPGKVDPEGPLSPLGGFPGAP
jgi:hypothetical protein